MEIKSIFDTYILRGKTIKRETSMGKILLIFLIVQRWRLQQPSGLQLILTFSHKTILSSMRLHGIIAILTQLH